MRQHLRIRGIPGLGLWHCDVAGPALDLAGLRYSRLCSRADGLSRMTVFCAGRRSPAGFELADSQPVGFRVGAGTSARHQHLESHFIARPLTDHPPAPLGTHGSAAAPLRASDQCSQLPQVQGGPCHRARRPDYQGSATVHWRHHTDRPVPGPHQGDHRRRLGSRRPCCQDDQGLFC